MIQSTVIRWIAERSLKHNIRSMSENVPSIDDHSVIQFVVNDYYPSSRLLYSTVADSARIVNQVSVHILGQRRCHLVPKLILNLAASFWLGTMDLLRQDTTNYVVDQPVNAAQARAYSHLDGIVDDVKHRQRIVRTKLKSKYGV